MSPTEHLEIETKYDVDERVVLPALHELPGVETVAQPVEHELEAVYYDTAAYDLAAAGITLRRRTGGDDDGWHVKLPASSGERLEVRHPLGRSVRRVPVQVVRMVRVHVRDRELAPVVTLRTRRVVHRLLGPDEAVLAELSDDQVISEVPGAAVETWREWELELVDGPRELLGAAGAVLRSAGATAASGPSKLARALGDRVPRTERWELPSEPSAVDVFRAYAAQQVAALHQRDPEVRRDLPDAVHKMRVATRRLRSALATYRPLLDREAGDRLRAELKWLAGELGGPRDAEVMRDRLVAALAAEPSELVMGRIAGTIDDHLRATYRDARKRALESLENERYFRLLDDLDLLVTAPPLTETQPEEPPGKATKVLPGLLRYDWKRIRKAVALVEEAADPAERSHELHEVRKAAKRLRYAAESAVPVFGGTAEGFAADAEQVQEVLGEYQDGIVARDLLRQLAVQVHLDGGNAFSLGRLHALEEQKTLAAEKTFAELWPDIAFPKSWK